MWIAPVQAAAPALRGAAPAAAPPGEAPLFDAALDASLVDGQQSVPAAEDAAAVPQAFDQRALIGWLLVGSPVDATTEMPSAVEAAPSETEGVDDEEPESVELEDDAGLEIPADVLLAAPTAPQQPVIVETVAIPVEAARQQPAEPIRLQDAKDARPAGDATPAAAESAQAKTTQAAPLRAVRAAEPQTAFQLEPEAASPDAAIEPDMSESRDAMLRAEPSAPQDRSVGASAPGITQAVAGARFVTGTKAPVSPVAVVAEPVATESAAAPAAEAAPVVQPAMQKGERDARDTTTAGMPRVTVPGPAIARLETQMGGGDAQGSEQDRRSPAAQRLAAALATMAPQAHTHEPGAGSAPAPVFSVAQPLAPSAAIAAPAVVTASPATMTEVDPENVHSLVQAMRVTAKAGGWEATVRLKPEHLGEVTIALRVDGKNVSAVVQAESAGVRQWLMAQEDAVRSGLSEQGLQLDRFAVSRDGQRREAEQQQPQDERRQRRAPRQTATGNEPRFEVVV